MSVAWFAIFVDTVLITGYVTIDFMGNCGVIANNN